MAKVKVVCYKRREKIQEKDSEELYFLRQQAKDSHLFDLGYIARQIEAQGALSAEDVEHAVASTIRQMRKILRDGNRIKLEGLGTFFLSFGCDGAPTPHECSIRNINKIHIRFEEEKMQHFVNASHADNRQSPEVVEFEMVRERKA